MATKTNTAEGGTDTTPVTHGAGGNSGGASGDYWDTGVTTPTIAFSSTRAARGLMSYRMPAATGTQQYLDWTTLNSANLAVQVWVYFTGTVVGDIQLLRTKVGTTNVGGVGMNGMTFRLAEGSGTYAASQSPTINTGEWYLINYLHLNAASAQHSVNIYDEDLTLFHSYGPRTFTPASSGNLTAFRWGRHFTGTDLGGDAYFDQFIVAEQNTMLALPTTDIPTTYGRHIILGG